METGARRRDLLAAREVARQSGVKARVVQALEASFCDDAAREPVYDSENAMGAHHIIYDPSIVEFCWIDDVTSSDSSDSSDSSVGLSSTHDSDLLS